MIHPELSLQPYPEYRDSGVSWLGEIPEHWAVRRLKTATPQAINGIWGSDPDGEHDITCVRVADFDRYSFRVRLSKPTLRAVTRSERERRILKKGDLLLEKSGGGDLHPVGAVMLYDHDTEAVCSNFIARMPVATDFDPRYLVYLHAHLYNIRLNVRSIKQTIGIQNIDGKSYLSETVAFPTFAEQQSIASFLDLHIKRIERFIRAKRRLITLLNEQKQAIIQQAVTRGLDPHVRLKPSGVDWLGDVPEHWDVVKIAHRFRCTSGSTPSRSSDSYYVGNIPWVRTGELLNTEIYETQEYITDDAVKAYSMKILPKDTLLIAMYGQGQTRGRTGLLKIEATINQACFAILPNYHIVKPEYLQFWFISQYVYLRFISESRNATQPNLNGQMIKDMRLLLPPLDEQKRLLDAIRQETGNIEVAISQTQREIDLIREYRTRLIADVVTGKLDVRGVALSNDLPIDDPMLSDDELADDDDMAFAEEPANADD